MPAAERAQPTRSGGGPRWSPPARSKKVLGGLCSVVLLALFVLAIRRAPPGSLEGLRHARALPILAGFVVFFGSHAFRAARLNLLLPKNGRIPAARAFGLSGAAIFVVQVVPFRGGDAVSFGLVHRELGVSWSHSGGVFVIVKVIDTVSAVLVGLAGATVVLLRQREAGAPWAAGLFCVLVGALALFPQAGGALLAAVLARVRPASRLRPVLEEVGSGLEVARSDRRAYAAACGLSIGFLAAHIAALRLTMAGLGIDASLAGIAFATFAAILASAVLPSPAGTFGTAETGWAMALALDGVTLGAGAVSGIAVHLVGTLAAGAAGLFVLKRPKRE
jgi:uncharacterized membrane protein YbhN (UPF0104 family)